MKTILFNKFKTLISKTLNFFGSYITIFKLKIIMLGVIFFLLYIFSYIWILFIQILFISFR